MAYKISGSEASETRNILASNLKRLMYENNLSQKEVASATGVSGPTVSAWCNGLKMPRPEMIDRLCVIFDTDRTGLLEKYNYRKKEEPEPQNNSFTIEDIMLAQQIASLDPYRKQLIMHIIETEPEQ